MATGKGKGTAVTTGGSTLSDLKTICQYHGWHDTTTAGLAALRNFINRTLQLLSILAPWPEYHKRNGVQSLTVGIDHYELSETNIGALGNVIRPGRNVPLDILPGGIDEWLLATKTRTTTLTIDTNWVTAPLAGDTLTGATSAATLYVTSAGTATVTGYADGDFDTSTPDTLTSDDAGGDTMDPSPATLSSKTIANSGEPTHYALRKYVNSSGEVKGELLLVPNPTTARRLYYCYFLLPAKLVNDSDVCDWPDSRLWLLEEALDIRLNSGKKDASGLALESADFMGKVRKAMSDTRSSYMPMPVREMTDWRKRTIREVPIQITV